MVSDIEQQLGARTTAETLRRLKPVLARGHFVWIMGADSFANLHHWHDWLEIPETLPLAILAQARLFAAGSQRPCRHPLRCLPIADRRCRSLARDAAASLGIHPHATQARKFDGNTTETRRQTEGYRVLGRSV